MAPARGASPRADSARRALFADHRRMEWRAGPAMGSRCGRRSTASWPGIPLSRIEGLRPGHESMNGDGRSRRRYYVMLLTVIGVGERIAPISIDATRFAINAAGERGRLIAARSGNYPAGGSSIGSTGARARERTLSFRRTRRVLWHRYKTRVDRRQTMHARRHVPASARQRLPRYRP